MESGLFKRALSYLVPYVIEQRRSFFGIPVTISLENGRLVLNSGKANYSYGNLHQVFKTVFYKLRLKEQFIGQSVLLLGMGGGSVVEIIFNELRMDCMMTAIEIDPVIIELSKKYFDIDQFENLEIVCADAYNFVSGTNRKFDLVIMDLFVDLLVPKKFLEPYYLEKLVRLMNKEGWLFFNFILNSPDEKYLLKRLEENLKLILKQSSVQIIGNNYVLTGRS